MMYVLFYFLLGLVVPYALSVQAPVKFRFLGYDWNYPVVVAVLLVVVVRGLAYDTGTDYLLYHHHYASWAKGYTDAWGARREVGYQALVYVLSRVFKSPVCFFALSGFIYTYAMLMIGRLFGKPAKFMVFNWSVFLFVLSFNLYRQYIAMSLIVLGVTFFYQQKYVLAGIMAFVSVLFHTSALVGLFILVGVWMIRNRDISCKVLLLALAVTTGMSHFVTVLLSSFADVFTVVYYYITGKIYSTDSILESMYETSSLIYVNAVAYGILIYYGHKLCVERPVYRFFFYLFALSCILEPVTRQEILMRLWLYPHSFTPVFLGLLCYKHRNVLQYPIFWGAMCYEIAYYLYTLHNLGTIHPLMFKF